MLGLCMSGELRGVYLRRWKTAPCLHWALFGSVLGGSAEQIRVECFDLSWLPLFTEGDVGNAEVEIMGLVDQPLPTPVRMQCTVLCLW